VSLSPLQQRLVRPALIVLGLNAVGFAVYTLPRALQERSLASRVAVLRSEAALARGQVGALRRRSEAMRANAKEAERFTREVLKPREATLLPVLAEIHKAAREEGLGLGREDYDRSANKESGFTRLTIRLPVSGSYRQLVAFLGRLEHAEQFLVVDEVSLRGRSERGTADLDVVLSTYFREAQEPDGA
jgi:Tfp pilus assembly protein PilO